MRCLQSRQQGEHWRQGRSQRHLQQLKLLRQRAHCAGVLALTARQESSELLTRRLRARSTGSCMSKQARCTDPHVRVPALFTCHCSFTASAPRAATSICSIAPRVLAALPLSTSMVSSPSWRAQTAAPGKPRASHDMRARARRVQGQAHCAAAACSPGSRLDWRPQCAGARQQT